MNNAGTNRVGATMGYTADDFDALTNLNQKSMYRLCQARQAPHTQLYARHAAEQAHGGLPLQCSCLCHHWQPVSRVQPLRAAFTLGKKKKKKKKSVTADVQACSDQRR